MGNSKLRTGIYSGSFNPIHIGHLALANWLCEYTDLDEIWFLVTPHNPLKTRDCLLDDKLRLEMVRLAIGGYPKFKASDFEFHLPRPSYTYDTLCALRETYPDRDFHLIIGADNWEIFSNWWQHERIVEEFRLYVYPRPGYPISIPDGCPHVQEVQAPILEISSSFIREAIREGRDVRFFLPEEVNRFIREKKLFHSDETEISFE